jgi:hypothetical protein
MGIKTLPPPERRSGMRKSFSVSVLKTLALALFASAPLMAAVAHEAHKIECAETSVNAMKADIQSMADGDAKTAAMKEVKMAEDMMANKDVKGCEAHMHSAVEAMEK